MCARAICKMFDDFSFQSALARSNRQISGRLTPVSSGVETIHMVSYQEVSEGSSALDSVSSHVNLDAMSSSHTGGSFEPALPHCSFCQRP